MKCKRHPADQRLRIKSGTWVGAVDDGDNDISFLAPEDGYWCEKCDTFVPQSRSKQGKRANRRGRTESARIAKDIGGTNHEVEGKAYDVSNDLYLVQSKKDNSLFPERIWKALAAIPALDGKIPALVIKDSPGPGKRVRGVVIVKYEDWLDSTGVKA